MVCGPGAVQWISEVFGECIENSKDRWSFAIGMLSNLTWIISSTPQIYQNWATKSVDGVSPFFFSLILGGDVLSFIGLLVNGGLLTQYITSIIFVLLDGTCYLQYLYYRYLYKKPKDFKEEHLDSTESERGFAMSGVVASAGIAAAVDFARSYTGAELMGSLFGWVGSAVYVASRVPQVMKNIREKKVNDLSPVFVLFSAFGNLTYLLSLFIKSLAPQFLWDQLPWIVGAFGPMSCDFLFLIQMCVYGLNVHEPATGDTEHTDDEDDIEGEGRVLDEL